MNLSTQELDHIVTMVTSAHRHERTALVMRLEAAEHKLRERQEQFEEAIRQRDRMQQAAEEQRIRADALQAEKDAAQTTIVGPSIAGDVHPHDRIRKRRAFEFTIRMNATVPRAHPRRTGEYAVQILRQHDAWAGDPTFELLDAKEVLA